MSTRSRLVLIIVTFIFIWGCGNSNQTSSSQPQVVRRKIVTQPSVSMDTQQKTTVPGATVSSAKPSDKEALSKTALRSSDPTAELLDLKDAVVKYQYRGIVDPFLPLIKEEKDEPTEDVATDKSKKKKRVPQTPLEKIDLTQLTLTAVFKEKNKIRGLVEEPTGKGYIVTNGTFIGKDGGQITKMLEDRIVITELSEDVMGKPVTIEHELKLRQSSGE